MSVRHIAQLLIVKEAAIGGFDGVRERNSDLAEDDGSGCGFLEGVDLEDTRIVSEHWCYVSEQLGKETGLVVEAIDYGKLRTVHEGVLFGGVAVEVEEHQQLLPKDALVFSN